jgi:hypothetical protein
MRMENGMETAMRKEIDELSRMTVDQLRKKSPEAFGEESRIVPPAQGTSAFLWSARHSAHFRIGTNPRAVPRQLRHGNPLASRCEQCECRSECRSRPLGSLSREGVIAPSCGANPPVGAIYVQVGPERMNRFVFPATSWASPIMS